MFLPIVLLRNGGNLFSSPHWFQLESWPFPCWMIVLVMVWRVWTMYTHVTFMVRNLGEVHIFSNHPGLNPGLHSSSQRMCLSIWVRSFLNPCFPSCYLLLLTYYLRGTGVLPKPRSDLVCLSCQVLLPPIIESLMGLPPGRWFSFSQAAPPVSTLSSGFLSESHTTQTAGAALDSLCTAQTFWWHDHTDSGERSGKQGTVDTAKLQLPYSFLSSVSNRTHWGTCGWRWNKIKWSHRCLFFHMWVRSSKFF